MRQYFEKGVFKTTIVLECGLMSLSNMLYLSLSDVCLEFGKVIDGRNRLILEHKENSM